VIRGERHVRDLAAQAFGDDGGVIGVGIGENGEKFLAAPAPEAVLGAQ